jgi:adenosylmethionine-8-amino-7-oxononanoate aminotransferase
MSWQYFEDEHANKLPDGAAFPTIAPDIAVMGTGIAAGYFPISCVMVNNDGTRDLKDTEYKLWHTATNQNHPIGCAAIVAALGQYSEQSQLIRRKLNTIEHSIVPYIRTAPMVHSVTGVGGLWGINFDPIDYGLHLRVKNYLREHHISAYSDGNTMDGNGNMIMFAPAFTISDAELMKIADTLQEMKF